MEIVEGVSNIVSGGVGMRTGLRSIINCIVILEDAVAAISTGATDVFEVSTPTGFGSLIRIGGIGVGVEGTNTKEVIALSGEGASA